MNRLRPTRGARLAGFVIFAALVGCSDIAQRSEDALLIPKQLRGEQIVVTLAGDSPQQWEATAQALSSQYGLRSTGSFPLSSIRVGCVVFEVPRERTIDQVIAQLGNDRRVESVQANHLFEGAQRERASAYTELEYAPTAIRADAAHSASTGKGVRIAIVDTGVDIEHPDLRGHIAKTANFVDGGETSFATDRHGTAVAGIIGAHAGDAAGIVGIAPDAQLIVAKACWYAGRATKANCSSWSLAKAIDFALGEHVQVLNLSLAGPPDALLGRLLFAAEARGVMVVAAASADGSDPGFPAAFESAVAVVASDAKGVVRPPAWLVRKPAVAAPGVDILTTVPGGRYDFLSGSSLSAGEVTGVVALLLQARSDLSPREIRDVLHRTGHPVVRHPADSGPNTVAVVDACAALALVGVRICD